MLLNAVIIEENKERLKNSISLISMHIKDAENLQEYISQINKESSLRVTIIGKKGKVIAESNTDKAKMDNHLSREEILKSSKKECNYFMRYSNTLKVDFLYAAKQVLYKDSFIYLRVATPLSQVMSAFYSVLAQLSIVFLALLALSYFIVESMNKKIIYDMQQLKNYLHEISKKNYEAVLKVKHLHEFLEISIVLKNIVKRLKHKKSKKK
jgi:two-component system phosphate regulon sensor histidine kinase PhoR